MKRKTTLFILLSVLIPLLAGCGSSSGDTSISLRVLNCEDYICEDEVYLDLDGDDELETYENLISAFEEYERLNGKNVHVIYECFDTNETMLSSLRTGKSTYDLVCPSDYTIQKMMRLGMLEPYDDGSVPNYDENASPYLIDQMKSITAPIDGKETPVHLYAKGYMWGTLGLLYNPNKIHNDKGIDVDTIHGDMAQWSNLWNDKYRNEMSIKDSMRDTYSVGIMQVFDKEISSNLTSSSCFDESFNLLGDEYYEQALKDYSPKASEIFNRCDKQTVGKVEDSLLELKGNVYGFEVDSGKDDMVKGHIGINLAWSGDAVYSIERATKEANQDVYYSIPRTGGNIWFDGWVMPKSSSLHKEEAEEFVNFLCDPIVAAQNMNSVGYTSFVAGDDILDLIRDWYDPRTYEMYLYDEEADDFVYDDNGDRIYIPGMEGSDYEKAVVTDESGTPTIYTWEEYNDEFEMEWDVVNLTYMFEGTLQDHDVPSPLGDEPSTNPYLFYTDERANFIDDHGIDSYAGKEFFAQYVPMEVIPKLAIMKDYGDSNQNVLLMWENVKGNNLPIWGVIVFAVILFLGIAAIIASIITKMRYRKIKIARRKKHLTEK